ncbi:alpha/beta fold hydrolase [Streptacidiphilus jiangxiensis]|uniref:Pimeloyl-ACP methyl ester carboxylesterase n=1 Tax=Streptacidiphilus jiangxiensis TaxID=235985 RepID=A0A1H7IEU4_STRJI|nr:alpha/beta hydrolase [Streptacidiphilus jiangxiensis]SEK60050.1 Pimeloyl-ACP methyl ester carboxylesterase [Streptacidiphilus jiangxiensis]
MTRYARNGEVQLAYEDLGGAGGEPLLLIMGLGTSRFWWPDGLVEELVRRDFHVVAYDQRDAGQSTHLAEAPGGSPFAALMRRSAPAYSAEDQTDDAVAVMDAMGWGRAHLFGHSLGGAVAQRTAVRHPGRVRTVTTSGAVPGDVKGLRVLRYVQLARTAAFTRLRHPETPEGNLAMAVAVARLLASPRQELGEWDVREFVEREAERGLRSFRDPKAESRQVGAKWNGGALGAIAAPALVLHGEDDPLVRVAAARDIAAAIPGARLRIMPGVGHFLSRETWPLYAVEIRALADLAATGELTRS